MIDRKRILQSFFQVKKTSKYIWHGLPTSNQEKKQRAKRKIELSPHDILIPSVNNKFWNKINKNGAVNIEIPSKHLVMVDNSILFDNTYYINGFDPQNS
jgi:hypothetical protein